jgi:hypothetical protein
MTTMLSLLAMIVLVALCVWVLGSALLRLAGVLLLAADCYRPPPPAHRQHSSPLARRVFLEVLPSRLDPTKRWGIPNVTSHRR